MIIVQPPATYTGMNPALYLAGPTGNCGPWRSRIAELLRATSLVLIDPNQTPLDTLDPDGFARRVRWEHDHLRRAAMKLFWFPPPTLCLITLYELGAWAMTDDPIFVGIHPDYRRRDDAEARTRLARPGLVIASGLDQLAEQVLRFIQTPTRTEAAA